MERPERYDPEDLEHLMLERGFDELLEEERAYALRHLESRAEYERMRALLHHVRDTKSTQAPMDADPVVRERVLAAFREQRRPQWQIWLNSVGGFLLPARPSSYWRPALALGTVAVLIFGSLSVWNAMTPDNEMVLAEVKQQEATAPAGPSFKAATDDVVQSGAVHEEAEAMPAPPEVTTMQSETAQEDRVELERYAQTTNAATAMESPVMDQEENEVRIISKQATPSTAELADVTTISKDELAAPVAATAKRDQAKTRSAEKAMGGAEVGNADDRMFASAPTYSEDDLLGLLRAAW
ncbi:MAG: hypothetical protein WBB32_08960 [Flavobacteriales bacterium]